MYIHTYIYMCVCVYVYLPLSREISQNANNKEKYYKQYYTPKALISYLLFNC